MILEKAVVELYYWFYGNGTNFHSMLYDLIEKADPQNRQNLRCGFPEEVAAFELWAASRNPDAFFAEYGMSRSGKKEGT